MTNIVTFPGLGLEFHLDRVAFSLFGHPVYWYGVIIGCGFLLAVLLCCRWAPRFGVNSDQIMDLLIFAVPLSVVGLRVYYVLFYLDLYREADGSRWGNFMNVEAYGGVTGLPWRMCSESIASSLLSQGLVDADGYQAILDGTLGVHPTFFYESLWNFVGIFLIYWIGKHWKKFDGQVFWSYVLWYGLGRFWIEGLRTDSLYFFGLELFGAPIRTSQVLAIVSAAVAAVVLIYELKFRRHDPSELYVNRLAAHRADAGEGPGGPEKKED